MEQSPKTKLFISKANPIHNNYYNYDKSVYIHSEQKLIITCPIHGDFEQSPQAHLSGRGCYHCGLLSQSNKKKYSNDEYINKCKKKIINPDGTPIYLYPRTVYTGSNNKVIITCKIHGDFEQLAKSHLHGAGCRKCSTKRQSILLSLDSEEFVKKCMIVHKNETNLEFHKIEYNGSREQIIVHCTNTFANGEVHGDFETTACNFLSGHTCPKCSSNGPSIQEQELVDYIKSKNINVQTSNRQILNNHKELDIYIPNKKIAIEYNGLYWHNELNKSEKYHLNKTEECLSKEIRLIHIFEDEWLDKKAIVKSRIDNLLGITKYHVYARKCKVQEISLYESEKFLERHHIQGKGSPSSVQIGLFFDNKLIGLMTFGQLRKGLGSEPIYGHYELLRFCNFINLNIVGGAGKLLSYFIKTYRPKNIISYCDIRWSEGNLYEKLGFTFSHNTRLNYWYIHEGIRKNRSNFTKKICVKKYKCPIEKTEHEFCFSQGWYRIYGCGNKVYKLNLEK